MGWECLRSPWSDADVDAAETWARSGGQWLSDPGVRVPVRLVRRVEGLVRFLDDRGAGLDELFDASGVAVLGERAAVLGLPPSGVRSCGGAARLVRCADGWVAASLTRPDDVASIPAWLGVAAADDAWSTIANAMSTRGTADIVDRASLLGIACAGVGEVADRRAVLVERVGDAEARPPGGLVVANLASLWAGPLAGDLLARLGGRVLTIESTSRPDGARATPAFFEALHGRSESVGLELHAGTDRRRLRDLLARVDVVIEGSRPRALEQMGIDARSLVREGPRIWVSITAHGRDEPQARRIGFGDDTAVAGGLVGWVDGTPRFVADAVADPVTGLTAAATVVQLAERGGRWIVDVALSRVAASVAPRDHDPTIAPSSECRRPRPRRDVGAPMPLGRDTTNVLTQLEVEP